uniref:Uncharacterized protein n=1 Tax=viral metagenome TaxID=1070528 RepID=A0A6M3K0Q3_9ZZZZ
MIEVWFSYGEIRYSKPQILFLLAHMDLLERGYWVPRHDDSGYLGSSKGRAYKHEGYFVKPIVIIAELTARLDATGDDGKLVIERYHLEVDELDLADKHRLDYLTVISRIDKAIRYCSGENRKRLSYTAWQISRGIYQRQ